MEELKKTTLRGEELGHLVYENKDNYIELVQIFVREDQREKGVGEELLEALVEKAKKKNINKICVVSTADEFQDFGKWLVAMSFKNISNDAPQWCLDITVSEKPAKEEKPVEVVKKKKMGRPKKK